MAKRMSTIKDYCCDMGLQIISMYVVDMSNSYRCSTMINDLKGQIQSRIMHDSRFYLSVEVVGYCGTAIRSYFNLMYITAGLLHHLYGLLTGPICDVYPRSYGRDISGNAFSSVLRNAHVMEILLKFRS